MATKQKSDLQSIETALEDYVFYWNNSDMDSWGKLFTHDVDYINRNGGWWKNNKDNIAGHKQIHKVLIEMGQPKTFSLEIKKTEFLNPEVAVVQAWSEWPGFKTSNSEDQTKTLKGIMTCIFVKLQGQWLIKTLHNTLRTKGEE
ncbi:SgcJ/EcaC family oxidoreductase [Algoriphagus sp. NG3]|uniref:YybH family protein n=1 Tax=Algoriphagus sp. NG3 TaxID=3097546 RepID=UPI002A827F7C|nr:SgcJ/EcaC family oxidoreductase [Algoriphagus sp. NG3]WPR77380.1 SgcJ/EcaC family oxidoreductase [Algoriphagus sp. NG3]